MNTYLSHHDPHAMPSEPLPPQEAGEQQALCELFAGAIGSYKNPHSHRHVALTAEEAAEMLILATHLLRIFEVRAPGSAACA